MSEMRERAAKAVREFYRGAVVIDGKGCGAFVAYVANDISDAALLAALNPEDEAMVERVALAIALEREQTDYAEFSSGITAMKVREYGPEARAAISALRAMVLPNEPTPDISKEGKGHE